MALLVMLNLAGHLLGGWAMDRLSGARMGPLVQAALVLLCIPGALGFVGASSLPIALVGATMLMLLQGAGAIMGLAHAQWLAPASVRGSTIGIFLLLANLVGAGGGPYAVGLLAGAGEIGGALITVILAAATIAAIAGVISVSRLRTFGVRGHV